MIDPNVATWIVAVLAFLVLLLVGLLLWQERDRRQAAERTGKYAPVAQRRLEDEEARRTRQEQRVQEKKRLAAYLKADLALDGRNASDHEVERDVRDMLRQVGR